MFNTNFNPILHSLGLVPIPDHLQFIGLSDMGSTRFYRDLFVLFEKNISFRDKTEYGMSIRYGQTQSASAAPLDLLHFTKSSMQQHKHSLYHANIINPLPLEYIYSETLSVYYNYHLTWVEAWRYGINLLKRNEFLEDYRYEYRKVDSSYGFSGRIVQVENNSLTFAVTEFIDNRFVEVLEFLPINNGVIQRCTCLGPEYPSKQVVIPANL